MGPVRLRIAMAAWLAVIAPSPGLGQGSPRAERPSRIVSLNMCTDELLLRLADRDRILSVTWLSQDPRAANMAEAARQVAANHGLAEEVIRLRPDLVVAGRYTTRATVEMLKRTGLRVVEFDVPRDLAGIEAQIRDFAALLEETPRGEALIAEMRRRLAAIAAPPGDVRPGAFVLRPNGFTAGRGSLVDDILTRAGLDNLAGRLDLGGHAQVPLETLVLENAEILVVDTDRDGPPSLATVVLQHPVFAKLRDRIVTASVPSRLWTCAGPSVIEAIERLRRTTATVRKRAS